MTQMRLMGSDVDQVLATAEQVVAALRAWPQLMVGDVSVVPNRRGPGARCYIEVLVSSPGPTVTVERTDERPTRGRRALPTRPS